MSDEILIQVIDIVRLQAIRPLLSELEAARMLGSEARVVLREAAASPVAREDRQWRFAGLLNRILRHPELELRVFLTPHDVDEVARGLVRALCFENSAKFSLVHPVGPNWVVLENSLSTFVHLDWFRRIFLERRSDSALAYPRHGEERYHILDRHDVAQLATGLRPLLEGSALDAEAEGLARLVARTLSTENLSLAYTFPL
ncbi:MAG TPA: hypothetical protein VKC66_10955 [Xanthobacteraceae bacterium]|nr:hypothetical protein [Xanthobacteraceae bacterium]